MHSSFEIFKIVVRIETENISIAEFQFYFCKNNVYPLKTTKRLQSVDTDGRIVASFRGEIF